MAHSLVPRYELVHFGYPFFALNICRVLVLSTLLISLKQVLSSFNNYYLTSVKVGYKYLPDDK
jgi:hypothetical protein